MDENSKHKFEKKSDHNINESQVLIEKCSCTPGEELQELCSIVELVKTPPEEIPEGKWEQIKDQILREAEEQRCDILTTLKDRISTTDSILVKAVLYLLVITVLLALGAGAYFVFDYFTSPTEAAAFSFFTLLICPKVKSSEILRSAVNKSQPAPPGR